MKVAPIKQNIQTSHTNFGAKFGDETKRKLFSETNGSIYKRIGHILDLTSEIKSIGSKKLVVDIYENPIDHIHEIYVEHPEIYDPIHKNKTLKILAERRPFHNKGITSIAKSLKNSTVERYESILLEKFYNSLLLKFGDINLDPNTLELLKNEFINTASKTDLNPAAIKELINKFDIKIKIESLRKLL